MLVTEYLNTVWGAAVKIGILSISFRRFFLLGLLVPAMIWAAFEAFIDPFPNSLWLVRLLSTNYLVSVSADLEIDGEDFKLERTLRCFTPHDHGLIEKLTGRYRPIPHNGQAGDNLAVTTGKGRLFIVNL